MRLSTSLSGFLHPKSAPVPGQAEPLVLPSWKLQVQHWPQFLEVMVVSDKKNKDLLWTCFFGRSTWVVAGIEFYCQNHLPPTIETYWNNGKMILGLSSIIEIMMCHDHPWPWHGWHISRTNVLHRPCSKNWWSLAVFNRSHLYLPESRATCYCNLTQTARAQGRPIIDCLRVAFYSVFIEARGPFTQNNSLLKSHDA